MRPLPTLLNRQLPEELRQAEIGKALEKEYLSRIRVRAQLIPDIRHDLQNAGIKIAAGSLIRTFEFDM